MTPRRVRGAGP